MENYIRNKKLERIWCVMRNISKKLLEYYDKHKRDLAWRGEVPAYYTWISEIMLQQTRVEAVKPYFARFIEELPTIEALANCEEEKLMKLWQGLGYYSRARNLKKAACQIMENYGGELPAEKKELLQLAGIGPYTAGAISSIAYGRKETAVDGNVIRVISRLFAVDGNVLEGKGRQKRNAFCCDPASVYLGLYCANAQFARDHRLQKFVFSINTSRIQHHTHKYWNRKMNVFKSSSCPIIRTLFASFDKLSYVLFQIVKSLVEAAAKKQDCQR